MGIWAMLMVAPAGRPEPLGSVRRTSAVIDGWDSWLFPIVRRQELSVPRFGELRLLFTVTGDGTHGELEVRSRRSVSYTTIEPVAGGDGWRFGWSGVDQIEQFIKESGPRGVRRERVTTALTSTFDTQLHAVHGLLQSLRLSRSDAFAAEDYLAGHRIEDPALPAAFRSDPRGSGVRAVALDHRSAGWQWLVGSQDLYDNGEPPCLVQADVGGLFVASDPPVSLRFFDDEDVADKVGAGGWVDVPAAATGSVEEYIAWARENVGVAGRAVSTPRRAQRGEVDDEPPESYETNFPAWRYRLAEHPILEVSLSQRAPLTEFTMAATEFVDTVRQELVQPLMAAYRFAGGDAVASPYGAFGQPNQMLVSVRSPNRTGDDDTYAIDTDEWRGAVHAVAIDRRRLTLGVEVCDPAGFASGLRWGRTEIVITPGAPLAATTLTIIVTQPHLELLGDITPVAAVIERAITGLGLSAGGASVGRTKRRPGWLTLLDETQLTSAGGSDHLVESGLFNQVRIIDTPTGAITWLQATQHPSQFDSTHATRLAGVLGAP